MGHIKFMKKEQTSQRQNKGKSNKIPCASYYP